MDVEVLDSVTGENNQVLYKYLSGETTVSFNSPVGFKDPEALSDVARFSPSLKMFLEQNLDAHTLEILYTAPESLYDPDGLYSKHVILSMFPAYREPVLKFFENWRRYADKLPGAPYDDYKQFSSKLSFATMTLAGTFMLASTHPPHSSLGERLGSLPPAIPLSTFKKYLRENWTTKQANHDRMSEDRFVAAGISIYPTGYGLDGYTQEKCHVVDPAGSTVFSLAHLIDCAMSEEINRFVPHEDKSPRFSISNRLYTKWWYGESWTFCKDFHKDQRAKKVLQQYDSMCRHDLSKYPKLYSKTPTGVEGYIQYFVDIKAEILKKQLQQQHNAELWDYMYHMFEKYPGHNWKPTSEKTDRDNQ